MLPINYMEDTTMDDAKGPLLAMCLFFLFGSTVLGSCTADTSDDPVAQENADNNIVTSIPQTIRPRSL